MKAIVTVGVSASGKTTWAQEFIYEQHLASRRAKLALASTAAEREEALFGDPGGFWTNINRDDARATVMAEKGKAFSWQGWNWKWEKQVTEIVEGAIANALAAKKNIVVSDTNLNKGRRDQLVKRLSDLGYEVEIKLFPISYEEAVQRDAGRKNGVGPSVIARQFEQWNAEFARRYHGTPGGVKAVLVDLDGTAALMHGRGPFEWSKVGQDKVNPAVHAVVQGLVATGTEIVFLSGRDGCCEAETRAWLMEHYSHFAEVTLFMRKPKDGRADTIIKEELFWEKVAPQFDVQFAIDDRPGVCRMWRALGIQVLQVGNPHIDF
jgi:predicted kinase